MNNWDLTRLYKNDELFNEDLARIAKIVEEVSALKGKLNEFESFKKYVALYKEFNLKLSKAYSYAAMGHDLNQKDEQGVNKYQMAYMCYSKAIQGMSWVEPELLTVGEEKLLEFCSKDKELEASAFSIKNLYRLHKYVLDEKSEMILANAEEAFSKFNDLYDKLCVVDSKSAKVKLSNKEVLEINGSNYTYYLSKAENQKDRKKIFEAYYQGFEEKKATLAGIYDGILTADMARANSRGYKSMLDMHLFHNDIDKCVYEALVKTTRANTAPLKKYIKLRKEKLGLKSYHTYDRFVEFVKNNKEYSYEEGKKLVLEADKSMGEDFYKKCQTVLEEGRVSAFPGDGKRTGAYSTGTYEEGPFILLNHNGKLDDVFTIAHEGGHSIHTMYSNEAQPVETADYTIFVAEIASTLNEQVLLDYMLKNIKDKNEKITLLQHSIDSLIATFYRQTLFADYELQTHKMKENGEPITDQALSNIMADLYKKYYGINLDREPLKKYVWAYIPHLFHTPFYVYQYATSYSASQAIYMNVKNNVPGAFDNYIKLLKSGGSDYPVELLKKAGVDLTTKEPFMQVVKRLDELVSQLEEELK